MQQLLKERERADVWGVICDDELEYAIRESISDIASELLAMESAPLSTLTLCEHALLYAYLGLDKPSEEWHDRALSCLNLAVGSASTTPPAHLGLYGGLAGFGWMAQHVISITVDQGGDVADEEEDDPLFEVDQYILRLQKDKNTFGHNYDLINGGLGVGVYWMERLPRKAALLGIRLTLDFLEAISTNTPEGITWFTPPSLLPPMQRDLAPSGYYNLGVAHGVPGVIAWLAQIVSLELVDEATQKASALLSGAMRWLLAQQRPPHLSSRYSSWTIPGLDCGDSRFAWCYGDLGIAAVLQVVAERTQNPIWTTEARTLTYRCASRQLNASVVDTPLCHGAFGNAHIFNRFYQSYQDNAFKNAALNWIRIGLALREPGSGVAGYYAWKPDQIPHKQRDVSFLSGAAGIALALLSTVAPIEPKWDRLMLLSSVQQSPN